MEDICGEEMMNVTDQASEDDCEQRDSDRAEREMDASSTTKLVTDDDHVTSDKSTQPQTNDLEMPVVEEES